MKKTIFDYNKQDCVGSVKRGQSCMTCSRCFLYFKKFVFKYRKTPMNQIPPGDVICFSYGVTLVSDFYGLQGFQDFIKNGPDNEF